jgi:hypothetical protein
MCVLIYNVLCLAFSVKSGNINSESNTIYTYIACLYNFDDFLNFTVQ